MTVFHRRTAGLAAMRPRYPLVPSRPSLVRFTSSSAHQPPGLVERAVKHKRLLLGSFITGTAVLGLGLTPKSQGDTEDARDIKALSEVPLGKLFSGWIAFVFCSSPTWVDMSEQLYKVLSKVPGVSTIAHGFIMRTFFNQFLGGETTDDCVPKIEQLRNHQTGTLLGYNIEADLDGSSKDRKLIAAQTRHVLSSIDCQAQLAKVLAPDITPGEDNRFWVRIKLTGLLPHPVAMLNGSNAILMSRKNRGLDENVPYPGLPHDGDWDAAVSNTSPEDRHQLLELRATMETIASKARDNNIRIVIDAEQTWYQPVIDALTDELMQEYNALCRPPTVIASFQAYLRRFPQLLDHQVRRAEEKGFRLMFKQIRGAYMVTEAKRWHEHGQESPGPVWATKAETDASFNHGMERAMALVASQILETGQSKISAIFATHNSLSIDLGIQLLIKHGLAKREHTADALVVSTAAARSIAFAQLYGMKDDLTNKITGSLTTEDYFPLVVKSMSYGDLTECLPFLARRATENKSVLEGRGGAVAERGRLAREIRRRIFGG